METYKRMKNVPSDTISVHSYIGRSYLLNPSSEIKSIIAEHGYKLAFIAESEDRGLILWLYVSKETRPHESRRHSRPVKISSEAKMYSKRLVKWICKYFGIDDGDYRIKCDFELHPQGLKITFKEVVSGRRAGERLKTPPSVTTTSLRGIPVGILLREIIRRGWAKLTFNKDYNG